MTALLRMPQRLREFPRRVSSARAGSFLMIAVFLFTLAAAFFPYAQTAGLIRQAGQALGLAGVEQASEIGFEERFESLPFIALIVALGASLCLSLYFRVRSELLRWRAARSADFAIGRKGPDEPAVAAAVQVMRRRGYRVRTTLCVTGSWQIEAAKGGSGVIGSVFFHLGVLLVLAAVLLSTAASFRGSVKLTEGQSFDSRNDIWGARSAGRWYLPPEEPLTFRLVRVVPDYDVKGATTVASLVEPMLEGKSSRFFATVPVHVSRGLQHAGVTIYQGKETGYAPLVVVEDAKGRRPIEGYIRLATVAGPERESFVDSVSVKDSNVSVDLELLPDAAYRNGAYVSRSAVLKKAVLHAVVREDGDAVFDEYIPVTRDMSAGGYTVFFGEVKRWSQIDVSDAPAVPVLFAATVLGSLGLALRLLQVRRRLVVTWKAEGPQSFDLTGSSEKFQRQFEEELRDIRATLTARLGELPPGAVAPQGRRVLV